MAATFYSGMQAPGSVQQGQQSQQQSMSKGGSYFSNPELVNNLAGLLGGQATAAAGGYMDYLQNPATSQLFTSQLAGLLNNPQLLNSEAMARQNLADQFRIGGGLNSGAFGQAGQNLESSILGNRQSLAANLLGQTYGQTLQGLQFPQAQVNPLINALTLQKQQSQSQGSSAPMGGAQFNWQLGNSPQSAGNVLSGIQQQNNPFRNAGTQGWSWQT